MRAAPLRPRARRQRRDRQWNSCGLACPCNMCGRRRCGETTWPGRTIWWSRIGCQRRFSGHAYPTGPARCAWPFTGVWTGCGIGGAAGRAGQTTFLHLTPPRSWEGGAAPGWPWSRSVRSFHRERSSRGAHARHPCQAARQGRVLERGFFWSSPVPSA